MKNNNILYLTSFNERLYRATGQYMIDSFIRCRIEGDLLATYEGNPSYIVNPQQIDSHNEDQQFFFYNLDQDTFLQDWIEANRDIIPPKYGGDCLAFEDKESGKWTNDTDQTWITGFNFQAARFFRKIASINYAMRYSSDYELVVLLDCDTLFKKYLPEKVILDTINDKEVLYHLGCNRRLRGTGIEAGFMVFRTSSAFPRLVIECYISGQFRQYNRWDDGFIYRKVLEEHPEIPTIDVVPDHQEKVGGHVIPYSIFGEYVDHFKGSNQRAGII